MSKVWTIDNKDAGVARAGAQRWPVDAHGGSGVDVSGGVEVTLRKEAPFAREEPFSVPADQLDILGASADPTRPGQRFPGSFNFDPATGAPLKRTAMQEPDGWTSFCSDDGLPATSHFSDIDLSGGMTFRFPAHCDFAVAGQPAALYAVMSESGVVYRFCPMLEWQAEGDRWTICGPRFDQKESRNAWARVGRIEPCRLPYWSGGLVGGASVLIAPTDEGPTAMRCPAIGDQTATDVVAGARCIGGAAERPGPGKSREFLIPAIQDGRLTLFKRWDDAKAVWRHEVAQSGDQMPQDEILAAPVMDAARHVYWVGKTGVLIAGEDGGDPPFWRLFEPDFRALRRARPVKTAGGLWQLGHVGFDKDLTLAYRRLDSTQSRRHTVSSPHFSGGNHTYAAPDTVRRYRTPWGDADGDDMLRMTSADGFLAPLVSFEGALGSEGKVLALHVESSVSWPFLDDEPTARTNVSLRLHEPRRPISDRMESSSLNQITSLDDVRAIIFGGRLFVMNRNHPQEFAPCASWPVSRSS